MNLIYEVVVSRMGSCDDTLIVTVDRTVAISRARAYNVNMTRDLAYIQAWVDSEHNWAYVNLDDGTLYDYADHGGRYPVVGDFSFAANPPENRKDTGPDEWVE